ncbi:hypothetical protein BGZ57DRAFT_856400 [Hyaloscypha finlandica]|nr:hypothetical protein F5882DRAFT_479917 [Hyaloscypha sp. PMI_1271]KAH8768834.1 hypothetical protein BGZ57DRAFT_856400 [Hyaloscypha finlandica]
MLYFRQYLFLTTGLATALALPNPASTDSLGIFRRSSFSVLDGAYTLDNPRISQRAPASDSKELEASTPSWEDDRPTTKNLVHVVPLVHRESNGLQGFSSPHDKRKFVVAIASQIVTSAWWAFDMWLVSQSNRGANIWRGGGITSSLTETSITFPKLRTIYSSDNQYRGAADFVLIGGIDTAEVIIKFTAEVLGSTAAFGIMKMITPPTCTVGGVSVNVESWSFDENP